MALKIISFIFIMSLAFGIQNPTRIKALPSRTQVRRDVPFDMNGVIQRVNQDSRNNPKITHSEFLIPNLEVEFLIDTIIVYSPLPFSRYDPSVAFDGINYFVVWYDWRSGDADIYGARVSQTGDVLDSAGISISAVPPP